MRKAKLRNALKKEVFYSIRNSPNMWEYDKDTCLLTHSKWKVSIKTHEGPFRVCIVSPFCKLSPYEKIKFSGLFTAWCWSAGVVPIVNREQYKKCQKRKKNKDKFLAIVG